MDLTLDHKALEGAAETRRYFAKFDRIIGQMEKVATLTVRDKAILSYELPVLQNYMQALSNTFSALSYKYLLAGRVSNHLPDLLSIDRQESGFPVYQELLQMASDAMQADRHLQNLPGEKSLKQDMVRHIMNEQANPIDLQFAMSQRLYYEALKKGNLFFSQNDPQAEWAGLTEAGRGTYRLSWAVYDSQLNIPVIYFMMLQDSGRIPLLKDERRWPKVQSHLMAQAVGSLKLLTIARGFDQDFDDLHPKFLRRLFVGPMYSHTFTEQTGPLREVLAEANGEAGSDWALAWTLETLSSKRVVNEQVGFFGSVEREVFELDPLGTSERADKGVTYQTRSLILPERPYQILKERDPAGFGLIRKYVVGRNDQILSYR